ncbi:MAG: AI-2E family transporter, partial [Alphaproteobacteria bacterium]|nr:AI-2E family transporter [Alphaproteobacteria bacterium]
PPPLWLSDTPWVGPYLTSLWLEFFSDSERMIETLQGYIGPVSQQLISIGAVIGQGVLDIAIGVFIAFFFFRNGLQVAGHISVMSHRFFGPRGQHLLLVSKKTVIGIVYGMLGTALAQGALAGIGFWIAGVPGAPFLGLLTFMLSFFPVGAPLIWVPATIWLFSEGATGMAIFMGLWGLLLVSSIDNVIRPYFISLGSSLPLLVVLIGVFGGIIAFGFIGLFIGPTLLAVAYALVTEWGRTDQDPALTENVSAA